MKSDNQSNQSFIDQLKTIDSPTLSNAIETFQVRPKGEGFTPLEIRCLFPEFGRMCGYAVTAQVETVTEMHPTQESIFLELFYAVANSPKPSVVAFQEIGGHGDYAAHSGEMMATIFTRLGAVGLVSDSGVRDVPEVRAMGFHYFARGSVVSHANFRIVRVGVPIQIGGLVIKPGDLLHGDENGLLKIPNTPLDKLPVIGAPAETWYDYTGYGVFPVFRVPEAASAQTDEYDSKSYAKVCENRYFQNFR